MSTESELQSGAHAKSAKRTEARTVSSEAPARHAQPSEASGGVSEAFEGPAPAPPNPGVLGLTGFLPGGIILGLWMVGYLPSSLPGGMIALVTASSGLFLMIATIWAARLGSNTVAAILGAFSAFWLSLGVTLLGLANNWFGLTDPSQTNQVLIPYVLAWLIVFVLLTVATLRLPLAYTVAFVLVDLAFALLFISLTTGIGVFTTLAGVAVFGFSAVFAYMLVDALGQDLGAKPLPMGSPISS